MSHSPKCSLFQNLDLYIYKHSIKMTDIGLTARLGDSSTRFEIWFRKRKPHDIFTLQAASQDVKQAWTEEISQLLWKQALRNRGNTPNATTLFTIDITPSLTMCCSRLLIILTQNPRVNCIEVFATRFRNLPRCIYRLTEKIEMDIVNF